VDRDAALADFDAARAEWEGTFAQVPDAALAYLKKGDIYAIGGLQVHVNWILTHYGRILDALIAGNGVPLGPLDTPAEWEAVNGKARSGLEARERRVALDEMAELHAAVRGAAGGVAPDDWTRKTPVDYGDGKDPYPTSPEDVIGWLREHYREHVQQCPELVAEWRSLR